MCLTSAPVFISVVAGAGVWGGRGANITEGKCKLLGAFHTKSENICVETLMGIDTAILSAWRVSLGGGQCHHLAITRVLLKKSAILVLDKVASFLDESVELYTGTHIPIIYWTWAYKPCAWVNNTIVKILCSCHMICLLIMHCLTTIPRVERIVVLEGAFSACCLSIPSLCLPPDAHIMYTERYHELVCAYFGKLDSLMQTFSLSCDTGPAWEYVLLYVHGHAAQQYRWGAHPDHADTRCCLHCALCGQIWRWKDI